MSLVIVVACDHATHLGQCPTRSLPATDLDEAAELAERAGLTVRGDWSARCALHDAALRLRMTPRRAELLDAIDRGQVVDHGGQYWNTATSRQVTAGVRPLVAACWAEPADYSNHLRLTGDGRWVLAGEQ